MLENNKTNQAVFDKIKALNLMPRARWQFMARNYAIWAAGFFALLFGAISVALTIHMLLQSDREFSPRFIHRPLEFLLVLVPFFWLACLAVFISLIYFNVKHTKKGYRHTLPKILLVAVLANLILGGTFYLLGLGERVDDLLSRRAPFYDQVINPRVRLWSNPEEGRLSGLIIKEKDGQQFELIDQKKETWLVSVVNARLTRGTELLPGRPARFVGQVIGNHSFRATEVLPIRSGRGFFNRFDPRLPPPPPPLFFNSPQY